jgi:hypothetical protein
MSELLQIKHDDNHQYTEKLKSLNKYVTQRTTEESQRFTEISLCLSVSSPCNSV